MLSRDYGRLLLMRERLFRILCNFTVAFGVIRWSSAGSGESNDVQIGNLKNLNELLSVAGPN